MSKDIEAQIEQEAEDINTIEKLIEGHQDAIAAHTQWIHVKSKRIGELRALADKASPVQSQLADRVVSEKIPEQPNPI